MTSYKIQTIIRRLFENSNFFSNQGMRKKLPQAYI